MAAAAAPPPSSAPAPPAAGDGGGGGGGGGAQQGGGSWDGQQRSAEWYKLREGRLTASAFSNALGFWKGGRQQLWEEKLGLREPFAGNEATEWGTAHEDEAVAVYEALTGYKVDHLMFSTLRDDDAESWLGASPDGLIEPNGLLEVKCPFNKGKPEEATPYARCPWYYVPQVQGQLNICGRDWCHVFSWTRNGSALYVLDRKEEYWRVMHTALSDFWWKHVEPAKLATARGALPADLEEFRPNEEHESSRWLKEQSKLIAANAHQRVYSREEIARLGLRSR